MANIVSKDYYVNTWMGEDNAKLDRYLMLAQDIIQSNSLFNITIPTPTDNLKKAICAQAESMIDSDKSFLDDRDISSASIDGFSYSYRDNKKSSENKICSTALNYLRATGLMSRGITYGINSNSQTIIG